jgi:O-antigen/teichoic acid export membrane protein
MFFSKYKQLDGNKKKVFMNVFWAMLGKIVNMAAELFVGILVARYLGPENYGIMNYVISYVTIFSIIATFGLSNIEVRELSKSPEKKEAILGTCFGIRFIFTTIAYLLIVVSLFVFKTDTFTKTMILLYGISLYSTSCFEVIRNYFTSIVKNEYVVKSEIARTLIGASIKIILLLIHAPLWAFIIAIAFDTVLVASGYVISYNRVVGRIRDWKYDKTIVRYFINQSFPLLLSGAAIIVYQRIDQVMIGNMIDKQSVGYFATAGKFLNLILFLPTVLTQTVTPLIVKTRQNGTKEEYEYKSFQFISVVVWISIILAAIFSVLAYWMIYCTYGIQYLAAVPVLQVMAWKTVGMAISSSGGQLIIIEKIQKWAVFRNLAGCIVCIALNLILIPKYGVVGSAYVTIITLLVSGFLANYIIPPYRHIFWLECKALVLGWKELKYLKSFVKK